MQLRTTFLSGPLVKVLRSSIIPSHRPPSIPYRPEPVEGCVSLLLVAVVQLSSDVRIFVFCCFTKNMNSSSTTGDSFQVHCAQEASLKGRPDPAQSRVALWFRACLSCRLAVRRLSRVLICCIVHSSNITDPLSSSLPPGCHGDDVGTALFLGCSVFFPCDVISSHPPPSPTSPPPLQALL